MNVKCFGIDAAGREVQEITIGSGVLTVAVLDHGATLRDVRLAGRPLILGFERLEDHLAESPYFGALCGRCANRIAGGRFSLDGVDHALNVNDGVNHLHGGSGGFHRRLFSIEEVSADRVRFGLVSADGDQGYPGEVRLSATYSVTGTTLVMDLEATTDAPTLVNLAGHAYFDFDGTGSILDHELTLYADRWNPVGPGLIPTGEVASVADTPYDFRTARPIRLERDGVRVGYDTNFVLADAPSATPRRAARLVGPKSGVAMELWTTEPGVQFYDGGGIAVRAAGLDGRRYAANSGLCLEPQRWPDAPNHPNFPSAVLRPGETYRQVTEYRFEPA